MDIHNKNNYGDNLPNVYMSSHSLSHESKNLHHLCNTQTILQMICLPTGFSSALLLLILFDTNRLKCICCCLELFLQMYCYCDKKYFLLAESE